MILFCLKKFGKNLWEKNKKNWENIPNTMPFDILEMNADTVQTLMKACELPSIARLCMCSKTYQTHMKGNIKLLSDENKKVICNKTWFGGDKAYTTFLVSCPPSLTPFLEAVRGKRDRWDYAKRHAYMIRPIPVCLAAKMQSVESDDKTLRRKRVKVAKEVRGLQEYEEKFKADKERLVRYMGWHDLV